MKLLLLMVLLETSRRGSLLWLVLKETQVPRENQGLREIREPRVLTVPMA
jgi:hypothetical protein